MSEAMFPYPLSLAGSTGTATIGLNVCVEEVIRVALRAMGFLVVDFCNLQSWVTTSHILPMRHWLKVFGVNTRKVSAKMVKFFAFGNRANKQFICKSVRAYMFPPFLLYIEGTISCWKDIACPKPAVILTTLIDFLPKSLFKWTRLRACSCSHITIISRSPTLGNRVQAGYSLRRPLIEVGPPLVPTPGPDVIIEKEFPDRP